MPTSLTRSFQTDLNKAVGDIKVYCKSECILPDTQVRFQTLPSFVIGQEHVNELSEKHS